MQTTNGQAIRAAATVVVLRERAGAGSPDIYMVRRSARSGFMPNALVFPGGKLDAAEDRLRMFLEQYWGGPRTYSDQRGHPRLRMRHAPFRIGPIERDAWLRCMHTAVASIDSGTLDDEHRRELLAYLEMAAQAMVNSPF